MSPRRGRAHRNMVLAYEQDLRLFKTPLAKVGIAALVVVYLLTPFQLSNFGLEVLLRAGILAIGAIGLNLLTGYCGQVSLGHAFFIGAGAYTAGYFGTDKGWPLWVYLPVAALVGLLIGAVVGPFAMRLRGNYLVIVTIGLVFVGAHLFANWRSVTGGPGGKVISGAPTSIGGLDVERLEIAGETYAREQAYFWLVWGLVGVCALLAKNIVRSRPGRAMQAIRDRDISAEIVGVSLARYKIGAFAVAGAMAAVAGALYGLFQGFADADEFGLLRSIEFVAIIIIGGIGTIFGSVVGALVYWVGQSLLEQNADLFLFDSLISRSPGESGIFSIGEFNAILFGLFIVLFLLFEPRGLAALWFRVKAYFTSWPFSY